jgi:hypothetical protein
MNAEQMISTHPEVRGNVSRLLVQCSEQCFACYQICISCADACVAEEAVQKLRQCIRLDLDCADICAATGALATRRTGSNEEMLRATLDLCAMACSRCADECDRHAGMHQHCRICAETCRQCEQACRNAMSEVGGTAMAH